MSCHWGVTEEVINEGRKTNRVIKAKRRRERRQERIKKITEKRNERQKNKETKQKGGKQRIQRTNTCDIAICLVSISCTVDTKKYETRSYIRVLLACKAAHNNKTATQWTAAVITPVTQRNMQMFRHTQARRKKGTDRERERERYAVVAAHF